MAIKSIISMSHLKSTLISVYCQAFFMSNFILSISDVKLYGRGLSAMIQMKTQTMSSLKCQFIMGQYDSHMQSFNNITTLDQINIGKFSKILNTGCQSKRSRQTTQSDQGLPFCYSHKHFLNSSPENQHFLENRMRNAFEVF